LAALKPLSGTESQIAWAEEIRDSVNVEFDRVAHALEARDIREMNSTRKTAALQILDEKRREVMAREEAGYFIREWQELRDQVRLMIVRDPRYKAAAERAVKIAR